MKEGWVCPQCRKTLAPHVNECDCHVLPPEINPGRFVEILEPLKGESYHPDPLKHGGAIWQVDLRNPVTYGDNTNV